ncbi:hypothetical protein [Actinomycetospora sp. CA-084318]|uniref:hypothetical protein n=1 Tax=Actinomycetospora sp. CA-084318 TaxID=3239892 RepID=UPI003D987666
MTADEETEMLASVFEERAEYLTRAELTSWTATTDRDKAILSELRGPGAKLLSGPRGCGKSTLLRQAYFEVQEAGKDVPVYVNYSKSLALEPLFHKAANALVLFRQWVLIKIILGYGEFVESSGLQIPESLTPLLQEGHRFVQELETGAAGDPPERMLGPTELVRLLEAWTREFARRRCILLLDDAAHAFSPEQQREFFEIFRELRSRIVSAKAAVYPGITSYSPNFHVGHEARIVEAWYQPNEENYLATMREIVDRRLPEGFKKRLQGREELVDYLALAAFGIPRGFLVMLSNLLGVEEEDVQAPTRARAEAAVRDHAASVRELFESLSGKLPRYKNFVQLGVELTNESLGAVQKYNATTSGDKKAVTIAFPSPVSQDLERMLSMLEYAGVMRDASTVSRGVKGVFQRYDIHYSLIIEANSLSLGRSFSTNSIVSSLSQRSGHAFVRTTPERLLGKSYEKRCTLDLAPCQNCGTPRLFEGAKFCMNCGRELSTVSVYDELLKSPIERLPLTKNKLASLTNHTAIKTVNDILLDEDNTQLRKAPRVGPVWSKRIKRYAEEFVSV